MEFSIEEIAHVAKEILIQKPQKIILFKGEMGVGKTTLIKALAKQLGVFDTVSSPTFSLVNEYKTGLDNLIYHFDFYRINVESEALDMGIEEYLYSGNWCFIEWSEKIPNLIPESHSKIEIALLPNGKRKLTYSL